MLISSLPPVYQADRIKAIVEHPAVGAVRYNTGMSSPYTPQQTVEKLQSIVKPSGKPLYIDLKGKQLRVIEWANLPDGPIRLNHNVEVTLPAKVYFRGDDCCNLVEVANGNELYVDPLPKAPVGRGQSVNIITESLKIEGGLLALDHEYIKASLAEGIVRFMLSFVESTYDLDELENAIEIHGRGSKRLADCEVVWKIESKAGMQLVAETQSSLFGGSSPHRLMAARDDLMIHLGVLAMPGACRAIVEKDPWAICASRLLLGLEQGAVSMGDMSDIEFMQSLGYKDFMLSDGISREHAKEALDFWQEYKAARA